MGEVHISNLQVAMLIVGTFPREVYLVWQQPSGRYAHCAHLPTGGISGVGATFRSRCSFKGILQAAWL